MRAAPTGNAARRGRQVTGRSAGPAANQSRQQLAQQSSVQVHGPPTPQGQPQSHVTQHAQQPEAGTVTVGGATNEANRIRSVVMESLRKEL